MKDESQAFEEFWGTKVRKLGFIQIPKVAIWYLNEMDLEPLDLIVIEYIMTFPPDRYHALSTIAYRIGKTEATVRTSLHRLEGERLVRSYYPAGNAKYYFLDGWVSKIQEYARNNPRPLQNFTAPSPQNLGGVSIQKTIDNKEQEEKKIDISDDDFSRVRLDLRDK